MRKKKVRVWGKVDLMEISAVGIPSYPDAHLSGNTSIVKALSSTYSQIKLNSGGKMKKEVTEETQEASQETTETQDVQQEEVTSENVEEVKEEQASEESSSEENPTEETKDISAVLRKIIKEEIERISPQRGLVETEKSVKDLVKEASDGELAMAMGLFRLPEED